MCKVFAVAKVTDTNRDDVWAFAQLMGELMTWGNSDGLGYAAFDKDGKIFGEKWLINQTAFKDLTAIKGINANKIDKIYNYFGDTVKRDEAQAIIMHTRAATCGKGIINTHPFVNDIDNPTVAIIHNGMIYNDSKFEKKYSTCDSEVIAHLYHDNKVNENLTNLNEFSTKMQGWYTVLALTKDAEGKMIMDAFSDTGRLGSYFIKELDTRIYSTMAEDVFKVAKTLGLTPVDFQKMNADEAIRIDVASGEQTGHLKFKSSPAVSQSSYWEGWENVVALEGNLDDEEFRNRWFGMGIRGHHHD